MKHYCSRQLIECRVIVELYLHKITVSTTEFFRANDYAYDRVDRVEL